MDALMKKRKALRTTLSRNVNKFNEVCNEDLEKADTLFKVIEGRYNELVEIDKEIFNAILEDKTDEEIATELEKQDEYRELFATVEGKVRGNVLQADETRSQSCLVNNRNTIVQKQNTVRLPKVELMKFGGDPKDWLHFWSLFQTVEQETNITSEEKFQYLFQSMVPGSRAYDVVKSFPPTADNYPKVLHELKSRFGRDGLLVQVYVRELLALVLQNSEAGNRVSLMQFYDKLECQLRALESLKVTSDKCACILLPLVESCLPDDLLRAWQKYGLSASRENDSSSEAEELTLEKLRKFIKSEVEGEERIALAKTGYGVNKKVSSKSNVVKNSSIPTASCLVDKVNEPTCIFCSESHKSVNCIKAKTMNYNDKRQIVLENKACFSCLVQGHMTKFCRRPIQCNLCSRKHPTIMCNREQDAAENSNQVAHGKEVKDLSNLHRQNQIYLQTLVVNLIHEGLSRPVRVLIDTGSMRSYILESTASELGLCPEGQESLTHSLFGGVKTNEIKHKEFKIVLGNLHNEYKCRFKVLDQTMIAENIPSLGGGPEIEEIEATNIVFSDVGNLHSKIEVLIGADIAGKLFTGKTSQLECGLVAVETFLGWTLMGRVSKIVNSSNRKTEENTSCISMFCSNKPDEDISMFWKLEALGISDPVEQKSKQELHEMTLEHFKNTVSINSEGRYEVCLPWIEDSIILPDNFEIAKKRLQSTIDKTKKGGYFDKYQEVFSNWQKEGIIELVPAGEEDLVKHYIPHRAVLKDSTTTPVRPVFDAAAHVKGKPSLNNCLEKGTNMIEKIPHLLNRFRLGKFGVVSDIKQAFLQISIQEKDRNFLVFLWVDEKGNLQSLRHCRVVFGLVSSPFLLSAVIAHHLQLSRCKFEDDIDVIDRLSYSFYVDNCVTSLNSQEELDRFINKATEILADGSFCLRGWEFNGQESPSSVTKVLGLEWNKEKDTLGVCFGKIEPLEIVTKRNVLSLAQSVFDPLGIFCPVTLIPKLLLQTMWKEKVKWDEEIGGDNRREFLHWLKDLEFLSDVKVPRWLLGSTEIFNMSIHMFCDASQNAYATAAFLRVESSNGVSIQLIQAKSRVAPIRNVSIPRLELLAATLSVRLYSSIVESSEMLRNVEIVFWSDSSTCLAWIKRDENWAVFVRNRVQEIRNISDANQWRFVPGQLNPADLPSRGCSAKKLLTDHWWEGPQWLYESEEEWPSEILSLNEEEINTERCKVVCSSLSNTDSQNDWYYKRFSKYQMLVRCIGWILRFASNCRGAKLSGPLSNEEFDSAEIHLLKLVQKDSFVGEFLSKLKNFDYFSDENKIIRIKTKVLQRDDTNDFRQPIVLPSKHPVVFRLIQYVHETSNHVGVQGLLSLLREKFWILGGRRTVRGVINRCVICRRFSSKRLEAPSATLPEERVRDPIAFEVCGVDMTGPIYLKGNQKAYICIFSCATVRAVHLELTLSLSTDAFIQSLRRFISRRGRPHTVFSDNGTNFTGVENLMKNLDWESIQDVSRIHWRFIPPNSPWWGGFYERLIRMLKDILKRVLKKTILNYEEMLTTLCDCESVINARPLTYVSEDPNDLSPITPSMFLQDLKDVRKPDLDAIENINLPKKAVYRRNIREGLKRRFRIEYLGLLKHENHIKQHRQPEVGEVVLIGNDTEKRINWVIGKITEVIKGRDGVIRTVRLKTPTNDIIRSVQRIYPLEVGRMFSGGRMLETAEYM